MYTDIVSPNIFKSKNDWNVISFKCKKYYYTDRIVSIISRTIKDETGTDPFIERGLRKRVFVQSRQIFLTMMLEHTKRTLESIGNLVGKDHATVLHSQKAVQNMIDTDKRFKELYDTINSKVKLKINNHGTSN